MFSSDAAPLYDSIGVNYDATRRADPYLTERLARHVNLQADGRYLDIACGTGNYTVELAARGGYWHGLDLSSGMVRSARRKSGDLHLARGAAAALPYGDGCFDGAVCTMALHHLPDLAPVFCEAFRVLRHGRLVIFTSTCEQLANYWLNEYFPIAMERSTVQMPPTDSVMGALNEADFTLTNIEHYYVRPDLQDLFLYAGKHRPELYLSETVRRGISTFSTLVDEAELKEGCARLQRDIESGFIRQVTEKYRNYGGDYVFIVASKPG
jgi:ubiquinone/menaquinone biosynthesis C-methylase UbiE